MSAAKPLHRYADRMRTGKGSEPHAEYRLQHGGLQDRARRAVRGDPTVVHHQHVVGDARRPGSDRAARSPTPRPAAATARNRSRMSSWCAGSRLASGSSASSHVGSPASTRASSTRARSPPDSSAIGRCARCVVSVAASARVDRGGDRAAEAAHRPTGAAAAPARPTSRARMFQWTAASCGRYPIARARARRVDRRDVVVARAAPAPSPGSAPPRALSSVDLARAVRTEDRGDPPRRAASASTPSSTARRPASRRRRRRSDPCAPPVPQQQHEEERRADQRHRHPQPHLARAGREPAQAVGDQQQRRAAQRAGQQQMRPGDGRTAGAADAAPPARRSRRPRSPRRPRRPPARCRSRPAACNRPSRTPSDRAAVLAQRQRIERARGEQRAAPRRPPSAAAPARTSSPAAIGQRAHQPVDDLGDRIGVGRDRDQEARSARRRGWPAPCPPE